MKLRHVILISLLLVVMLVPTCSQSETAPTHIEPTYIGYCDVSKPNFNYIEFILSTGWVLEGKVVVDRGNVVFTVTDYWGYHVEDKVIKAGESYSFSITAKQTGERYRCYFGFLPEEENLPRLATFFFNMPPEGWKKVE